MTRWDDDALARLRRAVAEPDLAGTRYEVVAPLGSGGMGEVWLVRDTALGREVALKVLHPEVGGEDAGERLAREARVLAGLEHPGLVPVHDAGVLPDGRAFYAMKRVEGRRLDALDRGAVGLAERVRLVVRACEAIAFAHARGVLHRDLKPSNVMLGAFGEVLVMDWGLARASAGAPGAGRHAPDATADGAVLGTPGWMAPEQEAGRQDLVDARTDVHGLGALLHFVLTGRGPGEASVRSLRAAGVPRPLAAVALKALAPAREDRYSSAEELRADLARWLDGEPVRAHRERPWEAAARVAWRYRAPLLLIATYLVVRFALLLAFGR